MTPTTNNYDRTCGLLHWVNAALMRQLMFAEFCKHDADDTVQLLIDAITEHLRHDATGLDVITVQVPLNGHMDSYKTRLDIRVLLQKALNQQLASLKRHRWHTIAYIKRITWVNSTTAELTIHVIR